MTRNATDLADALDVLAHEIHAVAEDRGWWEGERNLPECLALIHSEVSEALEEYRNDSPLYYARADGKPEGLLAELADVVIRVLDLAATLPSPKASFGDILLAKHAYNRTRPYRHGGKRA